MPALLQVIQQGELRGAEVFALDLCGALAREGSWDVSLVSLFGMEENYTAAAAGAGLTVAVAQPDGHARGFDLRLARRLASLIDAGRYRIVQANGAATLKYLAVARRFSRRPWALVYRAIGMGSFWRRGPQRRLVYRWLLAQPDVVVAVSRAVAEDLTAAARLDPRRVVVVPNGVEPSRIRSEPADRERTRGELGVAPSERLLIYVGCLAPEKNLSALLVAVDACRQQGLPVKALLVGDGPCRGRLLEDVQRHRLEGVVHLLPSQDRVGRFLAAADLCVLPSLSEGMPAALIEAGLAGIPAVAYAVGGVPEVIEHDVTGVLLRVNDEPALIRAVAALVEDGARRATMGEAARARYRRFEIAPVASAYSEMYGALLERRRRQPNLEVHR